MADAKSSDGEHPGRPIYSWEPNSDVSDLSAQSFDEAVASAIEEHSPWIRFMEDQELRNELGSMGSIKVYGYARKIVSDGEARVIAANAADLVLDGLHYDLSLGDPEGPSIEDTELVAGLSEKFVRDVVDSYEPWACEIVETRTVNVSDWANSGDNWDLISGV